MLENSILTLFLWCTFNLLWHIYETQFYFNSSRFLLEWCIQCVQSVTEISTKQTAASQRWVCTLTGTVYTCVNCCSWTCILYIIAVTHFQSYNHFILFWACRALKRFLFLYLENLDDVDQSLVHRNMQSRKSRCVDILCHVEILPCTLDYKRSRHRYRLISKNYSPIYFHVDN